VKSGSEFLGEIPGLAAGLEEGGIARRTRKGNGGHRGFGRDRKSGSDHINAMKVSARSAPSFGGRCSLPSVQGPRLVNRKAGSIQGTFSAILRKSLLAITNLLLMGCGSSHHRVASVDVFGSYFPAWLLSLLVGIVLTIIAASAGRLMDIRLSGLRAPLLCLSLILIFSISIWFWFFAS
jgi:hypothetical protein